jgi:hypothetical protein
MRTLGLSVICAGLVCGAAETWIKDDALVNEVQEKVRKIQPTRAEKRFDEIGWANSILHAEEVAARVNRPVFLLTYNGSIDTGRC